VEAGNGVRAAQPHPECLGEGRSVEATGHVRAVPEHRLEAGLGLLARVSNENRFTSGRLASWRASAPAVGQPLFETDAVAGRRSSRTTASPERLCCRPGPASQLRSGAHERRRVGSGGEAAGKAPVSGLVWGGWRAEAGARSTSEAAIGGSRAMDANPNVRAVLEVFAAIEQRDHARFLAHTHPDLSFRWPPSLPWNTGVPGRPDEHGRNAWSWLEVWEPLQPTAAERRLHPEVIAAAADRVVVRWRQLGRSPGGLRFDGQAVGVYQVQQERLASAQMFYFDPDAVNRFLHAAERERAGSQPAGGASASPMTGGDATGGQGHPNARLLEVFYQAQAAFYGGGDDPTSLLGLLSDDVAWHVPGRSPIAGDYHGHDQVLGYFATRRARANTSLRVHPRAILADDRWAVQLADGHLERNGQRLGWQTAGVFRIAGGKIAECWLLPFDQYRFDEIWS
jgi:ketosteroid isomerase-like protein